MIRVTVCNVLVTRGRCVRLCTGRVVRVRWMSVMVGSLSGETCV